MQWVDKLRKAERKSEEEARQRIKNAVNRLGEAESKLRRRMRVYPASSPESPAKDREQTGVPGEKLETRNDQAAIPSKTQTKSEKDTKQTAQPIVSINGEDVKDESDKTAA